METFIEKILSSAGRTVRHWWMFLVAGLLLVVGGITVFFYPAESYATLSIMFGVLMLVSGVVELVTACTSRNWFLMRSSSIVGGIFDVLFGLILCLYPGITLVLLPIMLGIFMLYHSFMTIGFGSDEDQPMKYPFSESFYARSKKEGEDGVLPLKDRMAVVIVNPTFMIGKYGSEKGSNRVFSMVKKSPVLVCPSGGKNVIDVAEAARGMVMAMEGGRSGEKYLICGENYSYAELFRAIAGHYGLRRCFLRIPDFLLKAAGALGDLLARCGMKVEFTSVNMKILMIKNYYDTDKAFRDFGFRPRGLFGVRQNS